MERRTLLLGGVLGFSGLGAASLLGGGTVPVAAARTFDWKGTDFLSGGTARIPPSLPEPLFRSAPNCTVSCAQTLGPCFAKAPVRTDISEGRPGLPTRVSLRLVDAETCNPVEGAVIDIWHCSAEGVYSGEAASMCNAGDEEARATLFCRGAQLTDANGRADFITVYPGWYPGRTVHIHLRVLVGDREALVSQLIFDDALSDLVFAGHPDYPREGRRRVRNTQDGIARSQDLEALTFDVEKLEGGVLQASFTLGISRQQSC
ncbi:MAG TPA: intradiol ring-cleavage dioxygenase [Erythrobacter sp.]|nr:intradiol ring-cleavage dioxygenase [Erythrobacter sp.]